MTIRLYDTGARRVRVFTPLTPGRMSMYQCGPSVQGPSHIGHVRAVLNVDILRRWLIHRGYDVTLVRNVTDIDDGIIEKSRTLGRPWWSIAYENERDFTEAYEALGCLPPTHEPRATGHVTEMVEMTRVLVERGHAHVADGDVRFDVQESDFALWKAAQQGEPSWETPWGRCRPARHLECTAMAYRYLGSSFDVHGGGLDLLSAHHENELAQATAYGCEFATYWIDNAQVTLKGEQMSESLGNPVLARDVVKQWRPIVLRYYLSTSHYRSGIDYSPRALDEAAEAFGRIEEFVRRAQMLSGQADPPAVELPRAFTDAMDDDLGVPQALVAVHHAVRRGDEALTEDDKETALECLAWTRAMLGVLGLDPMDPRRASRGSASAAPGAPSREVLDSLVATLVAQREQARADRDWAAADAVRDSLRGAGITVEDSPSGPRWRLA
ncbi:cysteine--tRNA ligase [Streptomyces sp. NPDC048441]|uniref:cysteine--tRNA ligase n=1 Tax=Streptomyces sp. NPDC048441 TaxID=3365552 RepID=UPI003718C0D9